MWCFITSGFLSSVFITVILFVFVVMLTRFVVLGLHYNNGILYYIVDDC